MQLQAPVHMCSGFEIIFKLDNVVMQRDLVHSDYITQLKDLVICKVFFVYHFDGYLLFTVLLDTLQNRFQGIFFIYNIGQLDLLKLVQCQACVIPLAIISNLKLVILQNIISIRICIHTFQRSLFVGFIFSTISVVLFDPVGASGLFEVFNPLLLDVLPFKENCDDSTDTSFSLCGLIHTNISQMTTNIQLDRIHF